MVAGVQNRLYGTACRGSQSGTGHRADARPASAVPYGQQNNYARVIHHSFRLSALQLALFCTFQTTPSRQFQASSCLWCTPGCLQVTLPTCGGSCSTAPKLMHIYCSFN